MNKEISIITFMNELEDSNNHPFLTHVTDNKTLHLPNSFVRCFALTQDITRNIFLLMMYLAAHIHQYTEKFEPISITLRALASDLGIILSGSRNYESMISMTEKAKNACIKLVTVDEMSKNILLFDMCEYDHEDNSVTLNLDYFFELYFIHLKSNKTIVRWGYLKQLSSLIAIRLYLIYASVQKSNHVLKYDIKHMMRVCGKETDNVGDFVECIIRATYEINTKTDISVSLHFIRKGHAIDAIMIKATTKDRECMRECGISADAPYRTLPKISKANMSKAVTTKKAFKGAPGFLINVSDKHVKTNLDKEMY